MGFKWLHLLKFKFYVQTRILTTLLMSMMITLTACQTTDHASSSVGPSFAVQNPQQNSKYRYDSDIFLDVAIPVFNPGIPEDADELAEEGIWPQLRRAEANRFALNTRQALQKTKVFGNVSVVPNAQVTADLFILGKITQSNSKVVEINLEVVDISGRRWGKKSFKHEVSEGFYRDKRNKGKDPYQPIFNDIAQYVYKLLKRKSEKQKAQLKHIADMRFASNFSPETYGRFLKKGRKGKISLTGLPDKNDPMSKRIALIRLQDQLFIDRLQVQYEAFAAKTDDSYHTWQEKTLPVVIAAEKAERKAIFGKIMGGLAIIAGAVASKRDSSLGRDILTTATIIGGGLLIKNGFGNSAEAKVQRATIDEMGESLDIEMDPQVMSLEQKTVKLTGTAQEQYLQWRTHLKKIFNLESGYAPKVEVDPEINPEVDTEVDKAEKK